MARKRLAVGGTRRWRCRRGGRGSTIRQEEPSSKSRQDSRSQAVRVSRFRRRGCARKPAVARLRPACPRPTTSAAGRPHRTGRSAIGGRPPTRRRHGTTGPGLIATSSPTKCWHRGPRSASVGPGVCRAHPTLVRFPGIMTELSVKSSMAKNPLEALPPLTGSTRSASVLTPRSHSVASGCITAQPNWGLIVSAPSGELLILRIVSSGPSQPKGSATATSVPLTVALAMTTHLTRSGSHRDSTTAATLLNAGALYPAATAQAIALTSGAGAWGAIVMPTSGSPGLAGAGRVVRPRSIAVRTGPACGRDGPSVLLVSRPDRRGEPAGHRRTSLCRPRVSWASGAHERLGDWSACRHGRH
jgi:hypothetical protein